MPSPSYEHLPIRPLSQIRYRNAHINSSYNPPSHRVNHVDTHPLRCPNIVVDEEPIRVEHRDIQRVSGDEL